MCFCPALYIFIFACNFYLILSSNQPEVTLEQGTVRGLYINTFSNRQIASFEGIPYAKPPIVKHRFKEPVPAGPWLGVYNATSEPPSCLQLDLILKKSLHGSEDCLYINVYTPQLPEGETPELLDVLAFIHGGAFYLGKSGYHGPSVLLQKDIVLVTFNYRLGPLGFLSTGDSIVPGNNGLKDQVLALKWIQRNIAAFGGNPDSVTLGGLSAGGASCSYHLLSPLSRGLFHRAICMSGVVFNPWAVAENVKDKTMAIANGLGCPINDSLVMIDCMRNRPAEHIVSLSKQFLYWEDAFPLVVFAPVIEPPSATAFISDLPINIIKEKRASDVPVIISFVKDEGLCGGTDILTRPGMYSEMLDRWDELMPHILDYNYTVPPEKRSEIGQKIRNHYNVDDTPEGRKNLIKMIGDRLFLSGISKLSKLLASVYISPVYIYKFSYRGKHSIIEFLKTYEDLGVSHADDIFYTLGFMNHKLLETKADLEVSEQVLDVFETFLRNGLLGGNWESVNVQLPKIVFTEIKGPNDFQLTTDDEFGEESFWDSLDFNENMEESTYNRDEL